MTAEEHRKIFSMNLKEQLYLHDMTQTDLAKKMDCSITTVNNWYLGLKLPRVEKIDLMCKIFRCTRDDLMENPDAKRMSAYYADKESAELAQKMLEDENLRTLMKAARNVSPESIKAVIALLEAQNK